MKKLFFLSLLAFAACKKTNEPPLGASNGGQNYLSCKINGKQYTFTGKPVGLDSSGTTYSYELWNNPGTSMTRDLIVTGSDMGKQYSEMLMRFKADTAYRFPLNQRISFSELQRKEVYVLLRSQVDFSNSYYYAGLDGWINISRADSIGAGTFGFTAWGLDHNGNRLPDSDSIIVTDGRFDIHK